MNVIDTWLFGIRENAAESRAKSFVDGTSAGENIIIHQILTINSQGWGHSNQRLDIDLTLDQIQPAKGPGSAMKLVVFLCDIVTIFQPDRNCNQLPSSNL